MCFLNPHSRWRATLLSVMLGVSLLSPLLLFVGCSAMPKKEAKSEAKKDDVTALIEAATNGQSDKTRELLMSGEVVARLNQLDGKLAVTPLQAAAAKGHIEIVRLMLDRGLPVDWKDTKGWTLLHYAVAGRQREIVALLLERKANPNAKSNSTSVEDGRISAGHAEMTPFSLAASGGDVAILNLLLEHKADIDGGSSTATPLYFAAANGHEEAVKFLLKRGAKVQTSVTFRAISDQQPKTAKYCVTNFAATRCRNPSAFQV